MEEETREGERERKGKKKKREGERERKGKKKKREERERKEKRGERNVIVMTCNNKQ